MPTIELRLPEPLLADLDAAAAAGGVTRSEELRRIIARELHGRYE
jgi:metal-responsive CopG/Arc/MetJ family transcriptional regulator